MCFSFQSCDEIDPTADGKYLEDPELDNDEALKESIILFEFTGWACIGCPDGHEIISHLEKSYQDRIHTIAIHAGYFAEPGNNGPDLRSEVGNLLYKKFDSPNQFPLGAVNIMKGANLKSPSEWSTLVANAYEQVKQMPAATLKVDKSISGDELTVNISIKCLSDFKSTFNLSAYIVENDIEGAQKNNSGTMDSYYHKHVLRASMHNGIIGENIGTLKQGETDDFNYTLKINGDWIPENLEIITFIYDTSNHQIIPFNNQYKKDK
jgi:hypothetical protein